MPASSLRLGIIGTGAFARVHAEALADVSSLTLAACCDTDRKRNRAFAETWRCTAYDDLETLMAQERLDLLTVLTPDDTHTTVAEHIAMHAHAPKVVVVEKPLCVSRTELTRLGTLQRKSVSRIIVDHSRRFNPAFERLRTLIQSGDLGDLCSVHWRYYAGWFHIGSHVVDTLRMLVGELRCMDATHTGIDRFEHDPLLRVSLRSERFPEAHIVLEGIHENPYALFESEMFFTRGRIRIQWDDIFIDHLRPSPHAQLLQFEQRQKADTVTTALTILYDSCAAFLRGEKAPELDGSDFPCAQGTMRILFDALECVHA